MKFVVAIFESVLYDNSKNHYDIVHRYLVRPCCMSVSQIIPININKTNISPRRIIHTHGKHSRQSTLEVKVKVVSARRLHRCRLQQPTALHPGLVDIIGCYHFL